MGPSSCSSVWDQNFFGIDLSIYNESNDLFVTGSTIVAGGETYYVDAIQHHDNCNSDVGLVYVANQKDCADGTPWDYTEECGFGGQITTPLTGSDEWCLYTDGGATDCCSIDGISCNEDGRSLCDKKLVCNLFCDGSWISEM